MKRRIDTESLIEEKRLINGTIQQPSGALALAKEPLPQSRIEKISAERYHTIQALSHSGMKDLAVSPYRFWYLHLNPNRSERQPTPDQKFGTALHCLVLEGKEKFHECYARMLDANDYPECLVTIEDLRCWLRSKGQQPKGTRKTELIEQVQRLDERVPVWDVLEAQHEAANQNKMLCLPDDWERLHGSAEALLAEPKLRQILAEGEPEVTLLGEDAASGTPLKGRLDWLNSKYIIDLKTFTQKYGKSIEQSIADALYYEGYLRQAVLYSTLYGAATGKSGKGLPRFVFVFVESQPPHEVRIKELRPHSHGVVNAYWQHGLIEIRHFCRLWADYMAEFGEKPWTREADIDVLQDEEIRQLAYR